MKQYQPAIWIKQRLRHESRPEEPIEQAVRSYHEDPGRCEVAFDGTAHELLNTLYIEWRKYAGSVHFGLYPTPMEIARELAELMDITEDDTVFDPGAGLGNLLVAASERGAKAHGIEVQWWIPILAQSIGIDIYRGDFLHEDHRLDPFNVVLANPPYGRVGQSPDATTDFMEHIADICPVGTRVGAILPRGHFESFRKKRKQVISRYLVDYTRPLDSDTFKPLTSVSTDLVVMTVKSGIPAKAIQPLLC